MSATTVLGNFVSGSRWADIPEALRREGRRSLVNFFGGALGCARDPVVEGAVAVMANFSGPEGVTVIGRAERLDAMGAAFCNAIGANLLDYDDTHLETVIHPTAAVAPPILALGEMLGSSGRDVLHAFILGAEVQCRIGCAVSPGHYARGWHITSTCSVFGAAAGCARLLGLDATRTAHALGIAASQSAGLVENLPTEAKNVGMGNAARNGLLAALLAKAEWRAAPDAIEGKLGWARAMGDKPDVIRISDQIGHRWEFARNTYKPYPAGIVFHAVIDACLELRMRSCVSLDAIAEIVVAGDQLLLDRGDREVRERGDLRVSIHHAAAVTLARGRAGVAEFEESCVHDPELAALRGRVKPRLDASLPRGAARVTLRLTDGKTYEATVLDARGSEARPLTDAELEAKFRTNAALGKFGASSEALLEGLGRIEDAASIVDIMKFAGCPA